MCRAEITARPGKTPLFLPVSVLVFPALVSVFATLYLAAPETYRELLLEDGPVEYLTVVFFLAAGAMAFLASRRTARTEARRCGFFILISILCVWVAVEEVSWGQRIMGVASPDFFVRNGTQEEINVHNVFQKWTGIKSRHVAAVLMLLYGVILPFLDKGHRFRAPFEKRGIPVPQAFLSVGFFLGALALLDLPTGREEEIGEWFLGICLTLFMMDTLWRSGASRR